MGHQEQLFVGVVLVWVEGRPLFLQAGLVGEWVALPDLLAG